MSRINKVTYIVYREWSDSALVNEITNSNYDINNLWEGNITCL
jgi:hypothetical protein